MNYRAALLAPLIVISSGCATIVGEPTQLMSITSDPSKADIVVTDERGKEIVNGVTPTSVTLQKSDGSYWGGKTYDVAITKEGFKSQIIRIESNPNGWYIAGNLVFGGLIGWFIVDPFNGDMYTLSPKEIDATLGTETSYINSGKNESITVMLIEDVPEEMRDKMTRIE